MKTMVALGTAQRLELEKFASLLGVDLAAAPDGSFSFEFERLGVLSIMAAEGDRVIVALTRLPRRRDADADARLFAQAGIDPLDGVAVHAALTPEGEHVLALDLSAPGLSAADFDAALSRLAHRAEIAA